MKVTKLFFILICIMLLGFSSCIHIGVNINPSDTDDELEIEPSAECLYVIELADEHLTTLEINPEDYKLILIENLVVKGKSDLDPDIWYLTYKQRSLIPNANKEIIGAGGEISVKVNFQTEEVEVTGYGE